MSPECQAPEKKRLMVDTTPCVVVDGVGRRPSGSSSRSSLKIDAQPTRLGNGCVPGTEAGQVMLFSSVGPAHRLQSPGLLSQGQLLDEGI